MIDRRFRGDDVAHARQRGDELDVGVEGQRYRLTPEASSRLWASILAEAVSARHVDEGWARAQFHLRARRAASSHPRPGPGPGRTTRVEAESGAPRDHDIGHDTPGKTTEALAAARCGSSSATGSEPPQTAGSDSSHGRRHPQADGAAARSEQAAGMGGSAGEPALEQFRGPALRDVLAAGSRAARSPNLSAAVIATTPDTALWRVTERRAARLYRQAIGPGQVQVDAAAVGAVLERVGNGSALPAELQREMESHLGVSLARVRIHTDAPAAEAARTLRAEAFTVGEDIYFSAGAFSPETQSGRKLLAHELAHVVQAQRGLMAQVGDHLEVSHPGDALERDADSVAERIDRATAPASQASAPISNTTSAGAQLTLPVPLAPIVENAPPALPQLPASGTPAPRNVIHRKPVASGGSDEMWQHMFSGDSVEVGKAGRVQAQRGIYLKATPSPDAAKTSSLIAFNAKIYVQRHTPHPNVAQRWAYVLAIDSGRGGFIEERYLALDPPEPAATLRLVAHNETLGHIARDAFRAQIAAGNDTRLYVQALYAANKGRAGVKLGAVDLSWTKRLPREQAEQATLKVYLGIRILEGQTLWIPSDGFVQQLKASGAITSGTTDLSKAWSAGKEFASHVADFALFQAGELVGVLEGAYEAVRDIFKGALDMLRLAFEVVKANLTGHLFDLALDAAKKLKEFILHVPDVAKALGAYIEKRWSAGPFGRGQFVGEIIGYVAANVLLAVATGGGSIAAMLTEAAASGSELARAVMLLIKLTDAATNPLKLLEGAGKGATVAEETAAKLKQALAHDAETARKADRGLKNVERVTERSSAGKPGSHGPEIKSGVAEPPEPVLRGGVLSERQAALDRRLASATESMIIIGKREVTATDLAALTKASGVEHALVILHDDTRALVRMSSYAGGNLPTNTKRLLMHSHPEDWGSGMAKFISGSDIEAIITLRQDYSYMVTLDGTVYRFTTKTIPMSIGEVVRSFHPVLGWVGKR